MKKARISALAAVSAITLTISACGGSSGGATPTPTPNPQVTGTVSAPGGGIAFNQPTGMERFFVNILGKNAYAAIEGVIAVGAGVTVNLIEVDANGDPVGSTLASAITAADGSFSIEAPSGFTPGPQFVIRAAGTSGDLDARVIDLVTNVDPVSDATSDIVATNVNDLSLLTASEITEINDAVNTLAQNVDPAGLTSDALNTALVSEASTNEELNNIVSSTTSGGQICGNVTDSAGTAVENIRIVVRDFGNWVTRAKTKTDANGDYCVNVPVAGDADAYISDRTLSGNYIMGALNFTGTSMAASQWWNSTSDTANGSGGANNQFGADMVSVTSTTTITNNFVLDANGSRIQGTVTNSVDGAAIEGMKVTIRNYDTFKPLAAAKVKADGSYRINVKAGDYLLSYRNKTRHPYASEAYRAGTDGVNDRNMASRESMTAGMTHTYDAVLDPGVKIAGTVTDDFAVAQPGMVVSINNAGGGRLEKLRTNKEGKFRIWASPRLSYNPTGGNDITYIIVTRGQAQTIDTNGDEDVTPAVTVVSPLTFADPVTTVSGTLVSNDANASPVGQAIVFLKNVTTSTSDDFGTISSVNGTVDQSVSNSDGSFTLYAARPGTYVFFTRLDSDINYGSGVYNGTAIKQIAQGDATAKIIYFADLTTPFTAPANIPVPTLGDADGGVGYLDGNTGTGSTGVSIRIDGTSGANGLFNMTGSRSRGDGSFKVTLPAGTYNRIRSGGGNCDTISIGNGATTRLTFDGTSTPPC